MLLFQLFQNELGLIIPWLVALLFAFSVHEFSHGFAARKLGDNTAELAGRLTLNPIAHIDPVGFLLLLLVGFGWARPVPINPRLIRLGDLGKFIVSFAGIFANLTIAFAAMGILTFLLGGDFYPPTNYLIKFLVFLVYINTALFVFNLLPIAPLDGYRVLESFAPLVFKRVAPFLEQWGFILLIALVFLTNFVGFLISSALQILSLIFGINIFQLVF